MPSSNDGHIVSEREKREFLLNYFPPMKSDNTQMRKASAFTVDFLFESRLHHTRFSGSSATTQLPRLFSQIACNQTNTSIEPARAVASLWFRREWNLGQRRIPAFIFCHKIIMHNHRPLLSCFQAKSIFSGNSPLHVAVFNLAITVPIKFYLN